MAKTMESWLETDVQPYRDKSVSWLSQFHFFRDPIRPIYSDMNHFFSPADGILIYQQVVEPDMAIITIKGKDYSLRDAMRIPHFDQPCIVIGIFMTFFDVHVNRIPYPGRLAYWELDPIDTYNHPMLDVEKGILDDLRIRKDCMDYLYHNQRMVNRIFSLDLGFEYYILQIADYDVDCITPFQLKQNQPIEQGSRFSMVRYGSQVDLIVPLMPQIDYRLLQSVGSLVEAGIDPLVHIKKSKIR